MSDTKNFLEEYAGQGFENLESTDLQIPFLKIFQSLSPQIDRDSEEYVKEAEPGLFYNSCSNEIYGKKVKVIPIDFEKIWLEWKPDRGGFLAYHKPGSIEVDTSNFSKWTTKNGTVVTEHYNFYCILPDYPEQGILILSLSSSGVKFAKSWNRHISYVRLSNNKIAPFFSSIWQLETVKQKNDKGSWYGINQSTIYRDRFITENELNNYVLPAKKSIDATKIDYKQLEGIKNEQELLTENVDY